MSQTSEGNFLWREQRGEADEASEVEGLEVEYLLLALDFGEILFLLAGFWPLQAALLEVFEPGGDGRALHRPRRVTAVLWEPTENRLTATSSHHRTDHRSTSHGQKYVDTQYHSEE